eukprot:3804822-Pleurochrysis_carterae.AAC.1
MHAPARPPPGARRGPSLKLARFSCTPWPENARFLSRRDTFCKLFDQSYAATASTRQFARLLLTRQ